VSVRHIVAIIVGFVTNTFLLVVVGELTPKALAIRQTLPNRALDCQPLVWFYRASYPFIWLLNFCAQWLFETIRNRAGQRCRRGPLRRRNWPALS